MLGAIAGSVGAPPYSMGGCLVRSHNPWDCCGTYGADPRQKGCTRAGDGKAPPEQSREAAASRDALVCHHLPCRDAPTSPQAGLVSPENPEQLLIALEPEAASIYCRKLRLHQLIDLSCKPPANGLAPDHPIDSSFRQGERLQGTGGCRRVLVGCGAGIAGDGAGGDPAPQARS